MINITTNFNGDVASDILMEAFNKAVMFNIGNAQHLLTVANKLSVTTLGQTGPATQPYGCDFVASDVNLVDKVLNPANLMVTFEFCKSEVWGTWMSLVRRTNMSAGEGQRIDAMNVDAFTQYVIDYLTNKVGGEVDKLIWQSNALATDPYLTQILGLEGKLLADATVIDVATPLVLTSANIVAQLEKVLALVPSAVIDAPDFKIYMNRQDFTFLQLFFANTPAAINANTAIGQSFLGYPIVTSAAINKNTIVATNASNIVIGTNIDSPSLAFNVIDMSVTTGDDKVRVRGSYSLDVTHIFGNQVVMHRV